MTKMRQHVKSFGLTAIIYICFVFVHANQNVVTTNSCPSILDGIPDQVITTGKIFQYKIPDSAFRISENAVLKISTALQNSSLPNWIYYDQENKEIIAVPTIHDGYGIYLKAILEDPKSMCASVSDVFHIAVRSWDPNIKTQKQAPTQPSHKADNTKKSKVCFRGVDLIQTTLIFAVNLQDLWAVDRLNLVTKLAHFLGIDSSVITVSTGNELFSTQDNSKSYSILASGHGNTVAIVPNATELTWQVPCNVFPEVHLFVQVLQHNVDGGRLTSEVGHNVVGWYISAMVNPPKQQVGRKKRFANWFMTPVPTPVPDLVPATKVKPTSSSTFWWWWRPETKHEETTMTVSSSEHSSSEKIPIDEMTKPFPPHSEIIGHTLTPSSHSSRISPTKSSYFISSSPIATRHIESPSSSSSETGWSYRGESRSSSESLYSSSSSYPTYQTSIPHSSRDSYTRSQIDSSSVSKVVPESSKTYTDVDSMSGSGDTTYTDEERVPVIETTVLPRTATTEPVSLFVTPSLPIRKEEEEDHSVTDMPYAGSGSGSGSDEEETPVVIQPSIHTSSESSFVPTPSLSSAIDSSDSNIFYFEETASSSTSKRTSSSMFLPGWDMDLFSSTTSSSWEIWITKDPWASRDKGRARETWHSEVTESSADVSSSRTTDSYPDGWYPRKEFSSNVWSSKDTEPSTDVWYNRKDDSSYIWSSKDTEPSTDVWYTRKEDSTHIWSSKDTESSTDVWYNRKDDSSYIWSSKDTEPSTDVWYTRKDDSTYIWSSKYTEPSIDRWDTRKETSRGVWSSRETDHSTDGWYSKEADHSSYVVESEQSKYTREGWWIEEIKPTREVWHTFSSSPYDEERSSEMTHETRPPFYPSMSKYPSSSMVHFEKVSSSQEPPYSYPSSRSSTFREIQGEFSSSIGGYVPTSSRISPVYIEEDSKFSEKSSSTEYSSTMIPDDCSRRGTCTTSPALESSSSWAYVGVVPTSSISSTESTATTPILPVTEPTVQKQYPTTTEPVTEKEQIPKKVPKKPKKRPTQPPIIVTTDYLNKAPRVRTSIGNVYAVAGQVFKYQIPKNTFQDFEDGNTRRLTLNVDFGWEAQRTSGSKVSWLDFDVSTQTLNGLPLEEDTKQSPIEVTINAIDKGGKLAQDVIMLYINSTTADIAPAYEFVMTFEVNGKKFLAERKHLKNLMKKLGTFFGDRDSSYITILDARPGSLILTWTNNSIPTDRCDNETVQEQRRQILDDNDRINPKFRKFMSPRFTVLDAEFNLDGACLDVASAPSDREPGDVAEVNPWAEAIIPTVIAVAIAIFIVVVILLVCSRKQRQKKKQKNEQRNSFEDQDPVMFHSERSNSDRGMRAKRAVILPGDVNPNSTGQRSFSPYQASGFGDTENYSDYDEEDESGNYAYNNGSTNPPPPYRLPPPYYQDNGSSYV